MAIIQYASLFFGVLIILYMIFVILTNFIMLAIAVLRLRKEQLLDKSEVTEQYINSFNSKPISIIVPAYNEEVGIIDSVHSLLNLRYPETEIIIINDGSTDHTQQIVIDYFKMIPVNREIRADLVTTNIVQIFQSTIHPNCLLVEKVNGGKADALNVGINVSKYPYFCTIDGDSILDETSLLHVMQPIVLSDGDVIATGGNVRIANDMHMRLGSVLSAQISKNYLVLMQIIEYLRAFLMGRIALSEFNLVLIISGAFGVFSKKWVIEAGGYKTDIIGEDMELVVRLHRIIREKGGKHRIEFVPEPVCWTEAPQSFAVLRRQRRRWYQGLLESLTAHIKMAFNPKYGRIGLISFPYFIIVEALGPIIELCGYIYMLFAFFLGNIYYEMAILLLLLFIIYGVLLSILAILFEAWSVNQYPKIVDLLRMILMAFTEIFWYRPLTLIWRLEGLLHFIFKKKEWGNMERKGFSKKGTSV